MDAIEKAIVLQIGSRGAEHGLRIRGGVNDTTTMAVVGDDAGCAKVKQPTLFCLAAEPPEVRPRERIRTKHNAGRVEQGRRYAERRKHTGRALDTGPEVEPPTSEDQKSGATNCEQSCDCHHPSRPGQYGSPQDPHGPDRRTK